MAQEMSFAQALNEAKSVIVQLSNRVQADAAKLRLQQQTIVSQSATIAQQEARIREQDARIAKQSEEIAALNTRTRQAEGAREHAEAMVNRQGEKITALIAKNSEQEARIRDQKAQIVRIAQERDAARAQLPSQEDAAALASMAQLLVKAAPAIEKARKAAAPQMRIAAADADHAAPANQPIAEAA